MSDRRFDVVVVGNVGVDTNVFFYTPDIDFTVEANFTENIDYVGQAGGYASRGYAQLGKRTAFIGHVGGDHCGQFVRDEFARDGIDTTALFSDPAGTSRSINFMYSDGRRRNFYDGKSHMVLQPDLGVCERVLTDARLAHVNIPNWARRLLPLARELGLTIACDVQDVIDTADPYRQDFIAFADILFFSAANQGDPAPLMTAFLETNPDQIVVAGNGARGCALGTSDGIEYYAALDIGGPVIDTNGAGDALAVGFLTSYVLNGYSLRDSILRGQIAARFTCTRKASTSNLITPETLEQHYLALRKTAVNDA